MERSFLIRKYSFLITFNANNDMAWLSAINHVSSPCDLILFLLKQYFVCGKIYYWWAIYLISLYSLCCYQYFFCVVCRKPLTNVIWHDRNMGDVWLFQDWWALKKWIFSSAIDSKLIEIYFKSITTFWLFMCSLVEKRHFFQKELMIAPDFMCP